MNFEAGAELDEDGVREIKTLQADNTRLRALIKEHEFGGSHNAGFCPWCNSHAERDRETHAPDCAMFTPDGAVR